MIPFNIYIYIYTHTKVKVEIALQMKLQVYYAVTQIRNLEKEKSTSKVN